MSSKSKASPGPARKKPVRKDLPATSVREFRDLLTTGLKAKDDEGRTISSSKWGVYAFFDYDGEPIYVGQTKEVLSTRVRRHLTNQRTDAVAMRILDTFEVAEVALWPLWELADAPTSGSKSNAIKQEQFEAARTALDQAEYSAYLQAIARSKFGAILNEKIPPFTETPIVLPEPYRFPVISEDTRADMGHPDIRIARRAETISRLAAVAHERGEVSPGLRRVLVIQAIRLTYLSAARLAHAEGRPDPDPASIDTEALVGTVMYEPADPDGDLPGPDEE